MDSREDFWMLDICNTYRYVHFLVGCAMGNHERKRSSRLKGKATAKTPRQEIGSLSPAL